MDDWDETLDRLLGERLQPDQRPTVDGPGVYALFLSNREALAAVTVGDCDVLYVGMTRRNSKARSHFKGSSSGSSLRRSLGALLKEELHLIAYPRGRGLTEKDVSHYGFGSLGEAKLTAWMRRHLTYSYVVVSSGTRADKIREIENGLISQLKSPLNIDDDWNNPDQRKTDRLRELCREEARLRKVSGA